jgi:hypothetical protein
MSTGTGPKRKPTLPELALWWGVLVPVMGIAFVLTVLSFVGDFLNIILWIF